MHSGEPGSRTHAQQRWKGLCKNTGRRAASHQPWCVYVGSPSAAPGVDSGRTMTSGSLMVVGSVSTSRISNTWSMSATYRLPSRGVSRGRGQCAAPSPLSSCNTCHTVERGGAANWTITRHGLPSRKAMPLGCVYSAVTGQHSPSEMARPSPSWSRHA